MFSFLKSDQPRRMRIVQNGHPALRAKSAPVGAITAEIRALAARMVITMQENDVPGVGLAAPQVGINLRLIVIDTRPQADGVDQDSHEQLSAGEIILNPLMPMALINPQIVWESPEIDCCDEGCLSLPGVSGEVARPAMIRIQAMTLEGDKIDVECGGLLARCLQHEIDHLNGVLFIDRAPEEQQLEAKTVMRKMERMEKRQLAKQ